MCHIYVYYKLPDHEHTANCIALFEDGILMINQTLKYAAVWGRMELKSLNEAFVCGHIVDCWPHKMLQCAVRYLEFPVFFPCR